jgi:nucleoside-diphosphate-sugar epimerase
VLVTGAGGFIGGAVAARYRSAGREVWGVDLREGPGVEAADISRPGRWERRADGCSLVVHTAAVVSNAADPETVWAVNVTGTARVLAAARSVGVERLVLFSSAAVYSHRRPDVVTEDEPVRPGATAYGDSKIVAEHLALQAHATGELEVVIVRPANVYGPGSVPWTIQPVRNLRAGRVVLPAMGRGVFDPVYVDDLVGATVTAAGSPGAAGRVFNVGGGRPLSTAEFFGHYARMLGVDAPRAAPTPVATGLAAAVAGWSRLRGRRSEVAPATMRMLSSTGSLSIERARRLLGWEPAVDLAEGMARTEAWLHGQGELA